MSEPDLDQLVAVVGMAVRVPGAQTLEQFWRNLRGGVESVTTLPAEELARAGVSENLLRHNDFVGAHGVLDEADRFDGEFFNYSSRESELLDPQQRVLLECAWHALEHAGYVPDGVGAKTGVFVGTGANLYLPANILRNESVTAAAGGLQVLLANEKDFAASRISYKLDLRGPSLAVQTACSTSLVAIHLAVQSLLTGESDLVLAGGASITPPSRRGYRFEPGSIMSPDGSCRPFDAAAAGTVPGDGVGVVVLKRLADAIRDRDHPHAVVAGSAVTNDGAHKAGFTAPGVFGQVDAISTALALAGWKPADISMIEAHATGTRLGDPVELAALHKVFGQGTLEPPSCALTAVKGNVGHLDAAAGVVGFVKTVLALRHGVVPPTAHFTEPNPELRLDRGPFTVPRAALPWPGGGDRARRAGVSSFGIGGTNAHVVLEAAPDPVSAAAAGPPCLIPVAARTPDALRASFERLADCLESAGTGPLGDVAFTLRTGRKPLPVRGFVVAADRTEAATLLAGAARRGVEPASPVTTPAFLFPGQGAQRFGMAAELFDQDEVFRELVTAGASALVPVLEVDLTEVLYGDGDTALDETRLAQPALFLTEYALARSLIERGVLPQFMIGHSVGEYAAACLAGVFDFDDALAVVAARGLAMQEAAPGRMLAVLAAPDAIRSALPDGVEIAAINTPAATVVSGPPAEVSTVDEELRSRGLTTHPLRTAHAFHSAAMDPVLDRFSDALRGVTLRPPVRPFVSGLTGRLITGEEATDPGYWRRQLRAAVRFADGVATLARSGVDCWIEVGPGDTLQGFVAGHPAVGRDAFVTGVLGGRRAQEPATRTLLATVGELWRRGHGVLWQRLPGEEEHRRTPLPGYPFARTRHWVDPDPEPEPVAGPGPVAEADPVRRMAALWAEVLGADDVTEDTDFFELGGHSLAALQLIARVRDEFSVELSLDTFFDAPTMGALLAAVRGPEPIRPVPVVRTVLPDHSTATKDPEDRMPTTSVYFFAASAPEQGFGYELVLEAARLADRLGFEAIWTPERHFHEFGGLFPNPAVLSAAIAAVTTRIGIRAGSVVLPLHHPLRIVEEWGIVDRLSGGRVGISFAAGFHPLDFVLMPDAFARRRETFLPGIEAVRELWRGGEHAGSSGTGSPVRVRPFPGGLQSELPFWVTASASDESFQLAGACGGNLLTALLALSPAQLAEKIRIYRAARAGAGHDPATGRVTVMIHTFVGTAGQDVREVCRQPFCRYLEGHTEVMKSLIKDLGEDIDLDGASQRDRDAILRRSFHSFYETRSLMGDQPKVAAMMGRLAALGVDEIAALVDFGLDADLVLAGLARFGEVAADLRPLETVGRR